MKLSIWFLAIVIGLVQGDYCYEGRNCQNDLDCLQYMGSAFASSGSCCNGKCTATPKYLARGSTCNSTSFCSKFCTGNDQCSLGVCTGLGVTSGCDCQSAPCATASAGGYSVQNNCEGSKCKLVLPQGQGCSQNSSCASQICLQGTCTGQNLYVGDTCRINEECQIYYACIDGKCAYKQEGMPCTYSFECDGSLALWCDTTTSKCAPQAPIGANCSSFNSQCVFSGYCRIDTTTRRFTNCTTRIPSGGNCYLNAGGCVDGTTCNWMSTTPEDYQCVPWWSLNDYAYCSNSDACKCHNCQKYGSNLTSYFCVPDHSIPAGGNCSADASCPEYGLCNRSTTPNTCTETFLNRHCDYNSTLSLTTQCGYPGLLHCSCKSKCEVTMGQYCPYYVVPGDPTKMNSDDMTMTANAYCCTLCSSDNFNSMSTSQTGFQIDCKSRKIASKPVCFLETGGEPLLTNCDKWTNVATLRSSSSLSLFCLLAFILASFY